MIISFCITFLQKLSRVIKHTKTKEFKKKQKVVNITKGHAFLGIYFETSKSCYCQVLRKSTNFGHFRVRHRGVKKGRGLTRVFWILNFDFLPNNQQKAQKLLAAKLRIFPKKRKSIWKIFSLFWLENCRKSFF